MYLIEILLPQFDRTGQPFDTCSFEQVNQELTEKFGGVTAFLRASAQGLWKREDGQLIRDEVAAFEVMAAQFDQPWWRGYRQQLEARFQQDEIVIRVMEIQRV